MFLVSVVLGMFLQGSPATILCTVSAANAPVANADVIVNGQTFKTDAQGQARIPVAAGSMQLTVIKDGFAPVTTEVTVAAGQSQAVIVELQPQPTVEEHVTVSATRTDGRVEDQAMRVEVLGAEEIEEKQLMTPGVFRYDVRDPVVLDRATYTLANLTAPTITSGVEGVATLRREPYSVTGTYTYVWSREGIGAERGDVPLTPSQSAGLVGMWERENRGRIGVEAYFTGRQRLEDNPNRSRSLPYVLFGGLIERRIGRVRVFLNVENLANVRQTTSDSIIRPIRAADGRWTVDAWGPLDGRVFNGGVRLRF